MNKIYIIVISLIIIFILFFYKKIKLENFGNIKNNEKLTETKIIKFVQPKQTDILKVTTSDGQQQSGAIAYKINGSIPDYQKFPINDEQCFNVYNLTNKKINIIPYKQFGNLSFTSDKLYSNVYISKNSKINQNWNIIHADNSTNSCYVYIASNTKDAGLNPPYYLEVEPPKKKSWNKKIVYIKTNVKKNIDNEIMGELNNSWKLPSSVKVTTIKNSINALWSIENVDSLKFLNSNYEDIMNDVFTFLEIELKISYSERKQFIQDMKNNLREIAKKSLSINNFISQIDNNIPNDYDLLKYRFGIDNAHNIIVDRLKNELNKLKNLYRILSVPFNYYLTANNIGGGINRGSVSLSPLSYKDSINTFWTLKSENENIEGFNVMNFIKNINKTTYKPTLVANDYPTITNTDSAAGWAAEYSTAWNGNYIYRNTSIKNPTQLIKVNLDNVNGKIGGKGTITVGSNIYDVTHVTKDNLIANNNYQKLTAKLVTGTNVNKGNPVMIFMINGENICGSNSQNLNDYCPKIDDNEITNYQNQYQSIGIKKLDMNSGLGVPTIDLNQPNPDPCVKSTTSVDCIKNQWYGMNRNTLKDQKKYGCVTSEENFNNEIYPYLENKNGEFIKEWIENTQEKALKGDYKSMQLCKGDIAKKYNGQFVKDSSSTTVYFVYKGYAYLLQTYGDCTPNDKKNTKTISQNDLNRIPKAKAIASKTSSDIDVAAYCIANSDTGKFVSGEGSEIVYLIYNGQKYWLPSYTNECGNINKNDIFHYNIDVISTIPPKGLNYNTNPTASTTSTNTNVAKYCKNRNNINAIKFGQKLYFRFPKLVDTNNREGRYLSGNRGADNMYVLVNPNSEYERNISNYYVFVPYNNVCGTIGKNTYSCDTSNDIIKYGDKFTLRCLGKNWFMSGSRSDNHQLLTVNPTDVNEASGLIYQREGKISNYNWSLLPGEGNNKKTGDPVLFGESVILNMYQWSNNVVYGYSNAQVHNGNPNNPPIKGGTKHIIIDKEWKYI